MVRVHAKPARPGLLVRRIDNGQFVAADGEWLIRSRYIDRRFLDGDLVECAPPADPEPAPVAASKKTAAPKEG
jgi:hypothetical protein